MRKYQHYILIIALLICSVESFGQTRYGKRDCTICGLDVGGGWYIPALTYFNEASYLSNYGAAFDGGVAATLGLEIRLFGSFFLGLGSGYWTDVAERQNIQIGGINRDEKLTLTMVPGNIYGKLEIPMADSKLRRRRGAMRWHPYIGGGTNINYIFQDWSRTVDGVETTGTLRGNAQTYFGMAGLRISISRRIDWGLEYQHIFGSFSQGFEEDDAVTVNEVDLTGPMALMKLTFNFYDRLNARYVKMIKRFRYKKRK